MISSVVWKRFVEENRLLSDVPTHIRSSWQRSKRYRVNPYMSGVPQNIPEKEIYQHQDICPVYKHLTNELKASIRTILKQMKVLFTVADKEGLLLYLDGDESLFKIARNCGFVPGASWSEANAGTNSIGTSIYLKKPVVVKGYEHFCEAWHPYECVSIPIFYPSKELAAVATITCGSGQMETVEGVARLIANMLQTLLNEYILKEKLSWQEEYSSLLFNRLSTGAVLVSPNKGIVAMNDKAKAILDKKPQSLKELEELQRLTSVNENQHIKGNFKFSAYPVGNKRLYLFDTDVSTQGNKRTSNRYGFNDVVGVSSTIKDAVEIAKKAAVSNASVLLEGETGTGKEVFAQAIHGYSERADGPFVALNCGAIPRELVVSELFGYEEGAFTGAKKYGSQGKFEQAHGGTLFLDEIGELPLDSQVMLLRTLQNREIMRIGGNKVIPVDVRVIAATNRELWEEVHQAKFRMDLYYRLNVIKIVLPPLRQRNEDILLLWEKCLESACARLQRAVPYTTPGVKRMLLEYNWPGNIRELQNLAERVATLAPQEVTPEYIPKELKPAKKQAGNLRDLERTAIMEAMDKAKGNKTLAAELLGLSRPTLYRKISEYHLVNN